MSLKKLSIIIKKSLDRDKAKWHYFLKLFNNTYILISLLIEIA